MNSASNPQSFDSLPTSIAQWLERLDSCAIFTPLTATKPTAKIPNADEATGLNASNTSVPKISLSSRTLDLAVNHLLELDSSLIGSSCEAMLWLRIGRIDRAHDIVQDATSSVQAYIHGIVHRLEGDYWNANYWFRRVRDQKLDQWVTGHVGQSLAKNETPDKKQVVGLDGRFEPSRFVNAVEACCTQKKGDRTFLTQVGQAEWQAVWEYVRN